MSMGAFAMILLENALLPDGALVSDELKLVLALVAGAALWFVTTQAEHLIVQIFGAAAGMAAVLVYNVAAHCVRRPRVPRRDARRRRPPRVRRSRVHEERSVHRPLQHRGRLPRDVGDVVLHVEAHARERR